MDMEDTFEKVPRHVAIIMDGNGRWAQRRGLPRAMGHRAGVEALRDIVRMSSDVGVEVLTVYAFSTENWSRPQDEVSAIFKLMLEYLSREVAELVANNVRIRIIGERDNLNATLLDSIHQAEQRSSHCDGLIFNVALNYGGRAEMLHAFKAMHQAIIQGKMKLEDVDESALSHYLYTSEQPDPDLMIRTGGDQRLSNFLLYQSSYAELYIPDTLWPDFDRKAYGKALMEYAKRQRRFGGIKA
jgi:undecaprenyl diphosphate synthase